MGTRREIMSMLDGQDLEPKKNLNDKIASSCCLLSCNDDDNNTNNNSA